MSERLPFEKRACFAAGQAKSGTTLQIALLDGHPQLLVMPEETAYFATVLTKYAPRGRRAQVDYLMKEGYTRVLFGGPPVWEKVDYAHFPVAEFSRRFERAAFAPENRERDLLVILIEAYAEALGVPLETIERWVEKTPANRRFIPQIMVRFPTAKILLTMRDPRAIFAAQIALERTRRTRQFSIYYCVTHWLQAAQVALRAEAGEIPGLMTRYEDLVSDPAPVMQQVCEHLGIRFEPEIVLRPTKAGKLWGGNSASEREFSGVTAERVESWREELSADEIGWVEWHCGALMPHFGYEPTRSRRSLARHWAKPVQFETPREYLKSRAYSVRDRFFGLGNK